MYNAIAFMTSAMQLHFASGKALRCAAWREFFSLVTAVWCHVPGVSAGTACLSDHSHSSSLQQMASDHVEYGRVVVYWARIDGQATELRPCGRFRVPDYAGPPATPSPFARAPQSSPTAVSPPNLFPDSPTPPETPKEPRSQEGPDEPRSSEFGARRPEIHGGGLTGQR